MATGNNSSSNVGSTLRHEKEHMTDTMSLIAGYYMIVVCILGFIENMLVLNIFRRNPKLQFVSSFMVSVLCVYDIAMAMCAFPFIFVSCITNTWVFGDAGCQWYGFAMTILAMGSISSLTCIALERFVVITFERIDPPNIPVTPMKMGAIACVVIGLALSLLPFFGIGAYEHEPVFLSCSPAWKNKRKEDVVFLLLIFACAFLLPVCLIAFSYIGICIKVFTTRSGQIRRKQHIKLLVISTLMIAGFLLSWGPYAVFALLQTFSVGVELTAMENIIPVMMAKSCVLWNPLICVGGSADFRKALKKDLHAMVSCFYDRFIAVCHVCNKKNSNEIQHMDTPNTNVAIRDSQSETSVTDQNKSDDMFISEQNDPVDSTTIWKCFHENNDCKCDTVKTYTFECVQYESCI